VPVDVRNVQIVSKVRTLGDFDRVPGSRVPAGGRFIAYAELADWSTSPTGAAGTKVRAEARFTIRILDAQGLPVLTEGPYESSHVTEPPLTDLFVARVVRLPATLPPGAYTVEFEAIDTANGSKAKGSTALAITEPAPRR
jgi:hypothetical protein